MHASTHFLIRAMLDGDLAGLDHLVAQGADVRAAANPEHWNLLHQAFITPSLIPPPAMVQHLIALGVDVNARDRAGFAPLHFAARAKRADMIGLLLDAGADIDPVTKDGATPLRLALGSKPFPLEAIRLLLARGADADHRPPGASSVREHAEHICHGADRAIVDLFNTAKGP